MAATNRPATSVYWVESRQRWLGSVTLPRDADGKRRRKQIVGTDEAEVRAEVDRIAADIADGITVRTKSTTVAELLEAFLTKTLGASPKKTVDSYRWSVGKMTPVIGSVALDKLKVEQVEAMLSRFADEGAARNSIARHRFVLRKALRWAQRREMIRRNVAELAEMPANAKRQREPRALTPAEARALLEAARTTTVKVPRTDRIEVRPRRLEALWVLSLTLGMRPGEVCGLTWPAIDLEEGVVHVRTSMKYDNGTPVGLGEVKTGNMGRGRRTLKMPSVTLDAMKRHRKTQASERLAMGDRWPDEWRDLVFVSEAGTPLHERNLRRELNQMTEQAELGHLTRYDLRHSAATLMAEGGMRLEDIADQLGHEDLRMARTVYVHATGRTLDAGAEVMGDVLSPRKTARQ